MSETPTAEPHGFSASGRIGSLIDADLFARSECDFSQQGYITALREIGASSSSSLSINIHIPFCPVRCFTCDVMTQRPNEPADIDTYLDSLEREIRMVVEQFGRDRHLNQLHLGGGSPTCLNDRQLVRLMAMLEHDFHVDETTDMALKVNPKYISTAQLSLLHALGFRHILFRLGDLDVNSQLAMGRVVSFELVQDVFAAARAIGFEVIGTDLVYGLSAQTPASLQKTAARLVELSPDLINIVSHTPASNGLTHQQAISLLDLPTIEQQRSLFDVIANTLASSGYRWIGLDCMMKGDDDAGEISRQQRLHDNWSGYTGESARHFLGFGTNAVSDLQSVCAQNHHHLATWSDALEKGDWPIKHCVRLDSVGRRRRSALLQLICKMELHDYAPLFGAVINNPSWQRYASEGLLDVTPERLAITEQGRYLFQQMLNREARSPVAIGL
jgi:oxygen-independent coproporphyrinogen-3 oxidase